MTFEAKYLGSNGWLIKFEKTNLLIDPWLTGNLVFPPGEWFFKGSLDNEIIIEEDINLILLTQSLPDHCHIPTLMRFKKNVDIICTNSARSILEKLNFTSIKVLKPSEKINQHGLEIEATAGAPVPQLENGYIVKDSDGRGFYIEPHGYLDKNLKSQEIDAVITPTINLQLPVVGPFIKGADVIPKLINIFNPKYILSSTIGGEAKYSGILNRLISVHEFKEKVKCNLVQLKSMDSVKI